MAKKNLETTNIDVNSVEAQNPEMVNRMGGLIRLFELERSFIIFSLIYFPVAWLFLNRGFLENFLLGIYTVVMVVMAVIILGKFVLHLTSEQAEGGRRLFARYLVDAFVPLLMLKAFGHILNLILPYDRHQGIVCDLVRLFRQFYYDIFHFQTSLNYIILGSLLITFVGAVWAANRTSK